MANQYTAPTYNADAIRHMYEVDGMSQVEIGQVLGLNGSAVQKIMKRLGIPARRSGKRDQRGAKNSSWRGGRITVGASPNRVRQFQDRGYIYVLNPDHPNAIKNGYVAEHTLVALESAGRLRLEKGEVVHHINLVRRDNQAGNLAIGTTAQHGEWHASLQREAAKLVALGLMTFDPIDGYALHLEGGT